MITSRAKGHTLPLPAINTLYLTSHSSLSGTQCIADHTIFLTQTDNTNSNNTHNREKLPH